MLLASVLAIVCATVGGPHPIIAGLGDEWMIYMPSSKVYHRVGHASGASFRGGQLGPTVVV